jgi:hypothetical protein
VAIHRALDFTLSNTSIEADTGTVTMTFSVLFTPLKPFKGTADLKVQRANGGRWIYKVQLEAMEAEVDDVIVIQVLSPIVCW